MKKFVILGSGTSGLISAAVIKRFWGDKVQVSLYYDANRKNIGVGESTTPTIFSFLDIMGISTEDMIRDVGVTIKLGINFKDWIPGTEFFHGFHEVDFQGESDDSSALYSIPNGCYNGGLMYDKATNTLPHEDFNRYSHALHIDTQVFSDYIFDKLKDEIEFIDDIAESINVSDGKIESIDFKNSGNVTADFYIDCSGFNALLMKNLDTKWNDMTEYLPIDRAIPQQVPYEFEEIPSYTVAEATDNGWIWQIPMRKRYGTGYLYSSRFTSDEEAREKYNSWLMDKFGVELQTDRVIKYKPGYYEDAWVGNCLAVGLSSGFVEPLESTGIYLIIKQISDFATLNSNLNFLEYNRKRFNAVNRMGYELIINFICLHYNTNREDSEFWRHITNNKKEWVKDFEEKCKYEFLDVSSLGDSSVRFIWHLDSYIQVAHGLNMFDKDEMLKFIDSKQHKEQVMSFAKEHYDYTEIKKSENKHVSHKQIIESIDK